MPITELIIIAKPITGPTVVITYNSQKPDKLETLGSVGNGLIAGVLVQQIVPLKEAIDREERRCNQ